MLRPIRNEEDYETALAEIEALWDAADGTPEADRLDVLMLLVETYEAEHYPIPDPACHGCSWLDPTRSGTLSWLTGTSF